MSAEPAVEGVLQRTRPPYVVPRVNLLPPEIRESSRLRVVQAGLVGGVIVAAGLVTGAGLVASAEAEQARADLVAAQAAKARMDADLAGLAGARDLTARLEAAEALLARAGASRVAWSRVLNDLSLRVPDGVWVESMTVSPAAGTSPDPAATAAPTPGSISFTGRGRSHDDVAAWLEALAGQPGLAGPTFSTSAVDDSLGGQKTVTFTSTVGVTPEPVAGKAGES